MSSDEDSETDDESATEGNDHTYHIADNDAVARQRPLAKDMMAAL